MVTALTEPKRRRKASNPFYMSLGEYAKEFDLNRCTAYRLAREDRLAVPVIRNGKRLAVSRAAVERLRNGEAPEKQSSPVG